MKPKHYVDKYNLHRGPHFDHNEFIQDLTLDFMTLLEVGKALESIKGFENAVRAIRMKWDGIDKKTPGQMPEKLWKYFYATVIIKLKEQSFPEELEKRRQQYEERKQHREYWKNEESQYNDFFSSFFNGFGDIFSKLLKINNFPTASFQFLQLNKDSSQEAVIKKFRSMSMIYHPDKGGDKNMFTELVEHKNKCLAYLQKPI